MTMPEHAKPANLHKAITIGIERALRDFGVELVGCTPSTLTGHVIQELNRIPGWRPSVRVIEDAAELDALPHLSVVLDRHKRPWQLTDHRGEPTGDEYGCWTGLGDLSSVDLIELHGPVTLVHEPR